MNKQSKIWIAGHNGLVGSAVKRELEKEGYSNIIVKSHQELDLTQQMEVKKFFEKERPEYVILAAAKVGGILANSLYPMDFIMENLKIEINVIDFCNQYDVQKLIYLGSSCIYPNNLKRKIKEEDLLTGTLERTNEMYAIAKIAGIKACMASNQQRKNKRYICIMPCNLYGINDNFDLESSHVMPALIRKFAEAKKQNMREVELWGTGTALREFLYVDDLASAIRMVLEKEVQEEILNVGYGNDISILELANIIKNVVKYEGNLKWDSNMPEGTYRKIMDSSKIQKVGWKPKVSIEQGIEKVYQWYQQNYEIK